MIVHIVHVQLSLVDSWGCRYIKIAEWAWPFSLCSYFQPGKVLVELLYEIKRKKNIFFGLKDFKFSITKVEKIYILNFL